MKAISSSGTPQANAESDPHSILYVVRSCTDREVASIV